MFAAGAGTSVAVDGTNTASHSGHDLLCEQLARKATAWARTPLQFHAHHSPLVVTQMLDGPLVQTALHKVDSWSSLQTASCCKAENQTCL